MNILKIKQPKRNDGNRIFFIDANAANLVVQHIDFRSIFCYVIVLRIFLKNTPKEPSKF